MPSRAAGPPTAAGRTAPGPGVPPAERLVRSRGPGEPPVPERAICTWGRDSPGKERDGNLVGSSRRLSWVLPKHGPNAGEAVTLYREEGAGTVVRPFARQTCSPRRKDLNPSSAINAAISRPRDRRASFSPLHLLFLLRNVTPVPPIHSARDE